MNLSDRFIETTTDLRQQATAYVARAAQAARASADLAADRVAAANSPLEVLTEATLKLNRLSHDHVARLLTRQATLLRDTLTEGEKRLQRLATAKSLQQAVAGQAEDLNDLGPRIARNARETWAIVADAGRGVSQLAVSTYAELAQAVPAPKRRKPVAAKRTQADRKPASSRRAKRAKSA